MPAPLATEKVLRGILRSLVVGGYFTSSLGEETLAAISNNASDVDISNAANSFTYNAAVITGVSTSDIISNGDLNCWVDADNSVGPHTDYFRVGTRGTTGADITKYTEILTASRAYGLLPSPVSTMSLGPRSNLLADTDTTGYSAVLNLGAYHEGFGLTHRYYSTLTSGPSALTGGGFSLSTAGLNIWTKKQMELAANVYLGVVDSVSNAIRGGFSELNADTSMFFVGPYPSGGAITAITLGKVSGTDDFALNMTKVDNYATLYVSNATTSPYSTCLAVNGRPSINTRTPTYALYNTYGATVGVAPALSVFGTQLTAGGSDVVVLAQSPAPAGYASDLFRAMADAPASGSYNLFAGYVWSGVAYTRMFRITGSGNGYCAGAFTGGGADLAEWMLTDAPHDPGSVLIMRNGIAVLSDEYEAAGVIGVVSSQPGLVMNGLCEDKENHVRVAKSGMVPVFFSSEFGDVEGNGELLCAGPGGYAVRAPEIPRPGSVVGKAMSAMRSLNGDPVCGVIQMIAG